MSRHFEHGFPGSPLPPTLCFPDAEKNCFACCPPIRPQGYEHIQYKNIVKRMLLENTRTFAERSRDVIPITGFSCWALGYLDEKCRQVGCLLHPDRNNGTDLRYRIDYGKKCQRETCPEANVFLQLGIHERKFWLRLADGLDSFSYSSRERNPLFNLLGWGAETLTGIVRIEGGKAITKQSFFEAYPFFSTDINPRANAYLIRELIRKGHAGLLKKPLFPVHFKAFSRRISYRLKRTLRPASGSPPTHRLKLDALFLDFIRLHLGLARVDERKALEVKEALDRAIRKFERKLSMTRGTER